MEKYTEARLEETIIGLLQEQGYTYVQGEAVARASQEEVLLMADIESFLKKRYQVDQILDSEIAQLIRQFKSLSALDSYESNKKILKWMADGLLLKREQPDQKDIHVHFIDYEHPENNQLKIVNQLEIEGDSRRIPDGILYINGFPLVVLEFKSVIREEATLEQAHQQLCRRYRRDIPELMKYNAFSVISDGVNTKAGSIYASREFWYAWRRTDGLAREVDGIPALFTMIEGMLAPSRLLDIIHHFIFLPEPSSREEKIICRYPQYYATRKLYDNILAHRKPEGDGKGGTYFGTTGCGKSYTMLFLARLLMKSERMASPTLVIITDRTDLDEQLSGQFLKAKGYIGDDEILSVASRSDLREKLKGRQSGGVFLTTIHKFNEDTEVLSERNNVVCISDEAHRSQINLDQKVRITERGVKKSYGFARHLHDSLPHATYVGFTGTPVDATLDVFGAIVDSYTMTESVKDEITVRLVYEGRAAKVSLNDAQLQQIEQYYESAIAEGASEYHVEKSKKESASMKAVIGDPDRIKAVAEDFVQHYETRVSEGSSVKGKALFVCAAREIAYDLFQELIRLRPAWHEPKVSAPEEAALTAEEAKKVLPMERVKMIMTRGKDDDKEMYQLLGNKQYRKQLDGQFKNAKSNFKIAIVVDMWLTGFDVPFLDTIYIDKPLQKHNLIQTISRVNRKFAGKNKGLVVDYIGIKKSMNEALAMYNQEESQNIEDIRQSLVVVKDCLDLLKRFFHRFDASPYFRSDDGLVQLQTLNKASEFVLVTDKSKRRFMDIVKRLKMAYDIAVGSEELSQRERDYVHFYLAVKSIIFKLTKGEAPDTEQMNARVKELVARAIESQGVEEIIQLKEGEAHQLDIFDPAYLDRLLNIKLPNTKIQLLQKLLKKAIGELAKVNRMQGVDFTQKLKSVVDRYNERKGNTYTGEEFDLITHELVELITQVKGEFRAGEELGIDFEEKAFYDILKGMARKYDFEYPEDKLVYLAQKVKEIVDDKSTFTDWNKREDVKSELRVELIILLANNDYPPVANDEVFQEIFAQAENFKQNR